MTHLETIGSLEDPPEADVNRLEKEKFPFLHRAKQLLKIIKSGDESKHLGEPPGEVLLNKIDLSTWVILDYLLPYIDKNDPNFREPETLAEYERLKKDFTEVRRLSRNVAELENTKLEDVNNSLVLAWAANKLMQYDSKFIAEVAKREQAGSGQKPSKIREQESFPYLETAKWLDGIIKSGEHQRHLEDGSVLNYREVGEPIWQLAEAYRQGEFSSFEGIKKYHQDMPEARRLLGRKANHSEDLLIGWIGNMLSVEMIKMYRAEEKQL